MSDSEPTIGVLIITHNEEENIARCLDSVAFADAVVVVDSESTDRTVEIARSLRASVHIQPWLGYSEQKQHALGLLATEWVIWLDADEELSPELADEIRRKLSGDPDVDGFLVPRMANYLGRWIRHSGWYPDPKLRIFRRSRGCFDGRLVHEGVVVDGPVGRLTSSLYHYPYRDVAHHREKVERYARLAAEQIRREGRSVSWIDELLRPVIRFVRIFVLRLGFLDGRPGFLAARMGASYVRLKYRYARSGFPSNSGVKRADR